MAKTPYELEPDRLARAISKLRPIEREVLLLSAREGLSTDRIAARLMLPPEAVKRHLADALCNLDRAVERDARPWWRFW